MPSVDITHQPIVVEATNDTSVVSFSDTQVVVEVPNPAPVVEFASAATLVPGAGLTGGGYLLGNVAIGLSPASVASLLKADTAIQPGANLSGFVDDVGLATDAEVAAAIAALSAIYQPVNSNLTEVAALSTTVFGRSFLTLANEAAARTLIGVYSTSEVLSLLALKANVSHTHTTADITGGISWSNLTGVPATFPPGAHTHVVGDITGLTMDHGGLTGLADDDHTQYHTDARGDVRYYTKAHIDSVFYTGTQLANGALDGRYYTETEIGTLLSGLAVSGHTHPYLPLAGGLMTGSFALNFHTLFGVGNMNDTFTYDGDVMPHYGIRWYSDTEFEAQGPTAAFASYGGIRFFTLGTLRAFISPAGDLATNRIYPIANNTYTLGSPSYYWSAVYGISFVENGTALSSKYLALAGGTMTAAITFNMANAYIRTATDAQDLAILFGNSYDGAAVPIIRGWGGTAASNAGSLSLTTPLTGNYVSITNIVDGAMIRVGGTNKLEVWRDGAWKAVADASQLSGGSYLPLSGGQLTGITNVRNATDTNWNRHFELTQSEGTIARAIQMMFHQENRWYLRIKAESTGFSFIQGGTDDLVNIAAAIVTGTIVQTANFLSPLGYGGANSANTFYYDGYGTMKFGQASTTATNVPEAPDNANFMISYESHAGGYGRQFYYPDNHNNWYRLHQAGTWGTWHKMARHEGGGYLLANTYDTWSASGWARALALRTGVGSAAIQLYDSTRHWGIGASGGLFYLMHTTSDTSAAPGMTYPMYCDAATMTFGVHVTVGGNILANNLTSYYNITLGSGYGLYLNPSLYIADRSSNTYGSIRVSGSKNNYSGIFFDSSYQSNGLMFYNGSNEFGLYSESGGWKTYYNGTHWVVGSSANKPVPWHDMGCAGARYTRGTGTPTGGSDGDVYFQYV